MAYLGSVHREIIPMCPFSCYVSLWSGSGVTTVHGPPCPHGIARTPSTPVVLVRLGLALCSLWLRVGCHGRIRLLHRHRATKVCALTQEVRFGRKTK